jgi:hypothetical protein
MPYTPATGTRPEDLTPNNFSLLDGYGNQETYSTVYDRPPAEMINAFNRHVGYVGFGVWLKAMGFTRGCNTPTIGHYEFPWEKDLVEAGAITSAAGGAGNDLEFTLTAASMYDASTTVGGAARKASYVQVGDIIEMYDGVQARVTAKDVTTDPHTITITPLDSTVDMDSSFNINEPYFVVTNLHPEGSGLPPGRAPRTIKYSNTFGIVKAAFRSSGTELTNAVYFEPVPGAGQNTIMLKIKDDTLRRFEQDKDGLLLFGQQADNITVSVTEMGGVDVPIAGTEGLWSFANTSGTTDTYTAGSYTTDDLNAVASIFEDERATNNPNLLSLDGAQIYEEREDAFTNVMANNLDHLLKNIIPQMSYDSELEAEMMNGTNSLSFGYYAVHKRGYTFHFKRLPAFNDVKGAGAAGYSYSATSIIMPYGTVRNQSPGAAYADSPIVGYEYKEQNGYSREFQIGEVGGVGVGGPFGAVPYAANENDSMTTGMLAEIAPHFACGNSLVIQEPA